LLPVGARVIWPDPRLAHRFAGLGQKGALCDHLSKRYCVYVITISDQPTGGPFDDVTTAVAYTREMSNRIRAEGGRWTAPMCASGKPAAATPGRRSTNSSRNSSTADA